MEEEMENNQETKPVVKAEATVESPKSQLEEKMSILEQRLNEMAKNASDKADAHADTLVAKWAKQIIDSNFTWAIVGGAGVYVVMSFFICM
jgi:hypothetical protein